MPKQNLTASQELAEDKNFDITLRPQKLKEFVGQEKIKENLKIFIEAAQKRREPIEHVLLYGCAGLGKTTLAHVIAKEMKANIRVTSGPALERAGDVAAILTNLNDHDILFIDEIHRLPKTVEEILYPAMEEYNLDIIIGKGPSARTLKLDLPKFTIIGATTKISLLSSPLRDRFGSIFHLSFYENKDIEKILERSAKILKTQLETPAKEIIAKRSRFTPRIANRLLRRVRDYAEVKGNGIINHEISHLALQSLGVDEIGLDETDRKILKIIIEKFGGGPVGLNTLAAASAEDISTLEDVYEPYLIRLGLLDRTARGRTTTELAYRHLGLNPPTSLQDKLLA
jgi:Holliday junction DNA helicase RuvB